MEFSIRSGFTDAEYATDNVLARFRPGISRKWIPPTGAEEIEEDRILRIPAKETKTTEDAMNETKTTAEVQASRGRDRLHVGFPHGSTARR
jgi:hypothetical protein